MPNIMLDLETMGTSSDAAIVAIGAVVFVGNRLEEKFYATIDLKSSFDNGGVIAPDTVLWWLKQSDEARGAFAKDGGTIINALDTFSAWVISVKNKYQDDAKIWGNGASFDNVILASAYHSAGIKQPWSFWNDRCFRTLKNIYPDVEAAERQGTHHNALSDAVYQAAHAIEITIQYKLGELK